MRTTASCASVFRPETYVRHLERLAESPGGGRRLATWQQGGVTLGRLLRERHAFARALAAEIEGGAYAFAAPRRRRVRLDKEREIVCLELTDSLVHFALAEALGSLTGPGLSPHVYSYRPGRCNLDALRAFGAHLRRHRRASPDPRGRGLYVVRADVARYTDSIDPRPEGALFRGLEALVEGFDDPPALRLRFRALLRSALSAACPGGAPGLPTGSALTTVLANFYLGPVDAALGGVDGGFYARFGDDLLFAHHDAERAERAERAAAEALGRLGLSFNGAKLCRLYLTACGRAPPAAAPFAGASHVDYLGYRVGFDGALGLRGDKARAFLRDMRRRAAHVASLAPGPDLERRGRLVCAALNRALMPDGPVSAAHAGPLRFVTDRAQLRQLDRALAEAAACAATGARGVRAFRLAPYRTVRRGWGLASLVRRRDAR